MAEDTSQGANDRANKIRDAEAERQRTAMEARRAEQAAQRAREGR